jgi:hypothetical protein
MDLVLGYGRHGRAPPRIGGTPVLPAGAASTSPGEAWRAARPGTRGRRRHGATAGKTAWHYSGECGGGRRRGAAASNAAWCSSSQQRERGRRSFHVLLWRANGASFLRPGCGPSLGWKARSGLYPLDASWTLEIELLYKVTQSGSR